MQVNLTDTKKKRDLEKTEWSKRKVFERGRGRLLETPMAMALLPRQNNLLVRVSIGLNICVFFYLAFIQISNNSNSSNTNDSKPHQKHIMGENEQSKLRLSNSLNELLALGKAGHPSGEVGSAGGSLSSSGVEVVGGPIKDQGRGGLTFYQINQTSKEESSNSVNRYINAYFAIDDGSGVMGQSQGQRQNAAVAARSGNSNSAQNVVETNRQTGKNNLGSKSSQVVANGEDNGGSGAVSLQKGNSSKNSDNNAIDSNNNDNSISNSDNIGVVESKTLVFESPLQQPQSQEGLFEDDVSNEPQVPYPIRCENVDPLPKYVQRGKYWVLLNYIVGDRRFKCDESVTYTTHSDYTFLDNLETLCSRWDGPVSVALYAPKTDFEPTLQSIRYLRQCGSSSQVRDFVTFHIFFDQNFIPAAIPSPDDARKDSASINCSSNPPWIPPSTAAGGGGGGGSSDDSTPSSSENRIVTFKKKMDLSYPVNVGRNAARDSAMTHFVLPSDIELYPNPGLITDFLNLVQSNDSSIHNTTNPKVFVLSIFELQANESLPATKPELVDLIKRKKAIPFHARVCPGCHRIPKAKEWLADQQALSSSAEADGGSAMKVFHVAKRYKPYHHWEPIFIGTKQDPSYDERLSWEGMSDKMTQGYILCVLDYDFLILDNAFLVHRPGIKTYKKDPKRNVHVAKQNNYIRKVIFQELKLLYGFKKGCSLT